MCPTSPVPIVYKRDTMCPTSPVPIVYKRDTMCPTSSYIYVACCIITSRNQIGCELARSGICLTYRHDSDAGNMASFGPIHERGKLLDLWLVFVKIGEVMLASPERASASPQMQPHALPARAQVCETEVVFFSFQRRQLRLLFIKTGFAAPKKKKHLYTVTFLHLLRDIVPFPILSTPLQNWSKTETCSSTTIMGGGGNQKAEAEALEVARAGGHQVDALIVEIEQELEAAGGLKRGFFNIEFKDPRHFTWLLVAFASMGGLLSGLDQSLISGANLYLPGDLGLDAHQNSLVNSGMPLGAVGGALILSPANEYLGRKGAIYLSLFLYTIGAAMEAGSINYGKQLAIMYNHAQFH